MACSMDGRLYTLLACWKCSLDFLMACMLPRAFLLNQGDYVSAMHVTCLTHDWFTFTCGHHIIFSLDRYSIFCEKGDYSCVGSLAHAHEGVQKVVKCIGFSVLFWQLRHGQCCHVGPCADLPVCPAYTSCEAAQYWESCLFLLFSLM